MEGSGFQELPRPAEVSDPLKQKLEKISEKEAPKDFPKISINILYGSHGTKEDLAGLGFRKKLRESDIYIPELLGWKKSDLKRLNEFSFGGASMTDIDLWISGFLKIMSGFAIEQIRAIRNSFKPITAIDLPDSNSIVKAYKKSVLGAITISGGFSNGLNAIRETYKTFATLNKIREEYMISHLIPQVQEVLESFPNLKKKKELRILMTLGSAHTAVYQNFKRDRLSTEREFNSMPYIFTFAGEARRRYMFDKKVDDQLTAKVMLELLLPKELASIYPGSKDKNDGKRSYFIRRIIDTFDMKDAEEIYNAWLTGKNRKEQQRKRAGLFFMKLNQKGIVLPKSEQELDDFLAKPLPPRPNLQPPNP